MVLCSTSDADELTSHLSGHGLVDVQNENLICRRETTRRSILRRNVIRTESHTIYIVTLQLHTYFSFTYLFCLINGVCFFYSSLSALWQYTVL